MVSRLGRVLTHSRFCSSATRSSFVSRVELLQHAPGTTSRMFPVCNACQNALTLPDSSSALSIPPTPFWSSLQRFHRQRPLVISRRYRTNKFSSSTMYFVIDEPCTAQLFIGIRHQFPSSDISHFPPWVAAGERTFQPIFSGSAIGFLRHRRTKA